jgi:hypothetical protein
VLALGSPHVAGPLQQEDSLPCAPQIAGGRWLGLRTRALWGSGALRARPCDA